MGGLHRWAVGQLPTHKGGCTLDLDSWALLHEDGRQQGVAVGYTRRGLKPCHRPPVAALAEAEMIAGYGLRSGNTLCANGAAEFLRQPVEGLPRHVRIGLLRADSGLSHESVLQAAESLGLRYIMAARLTQPVQALCRHTDEHWQDTEVPGIQVQEVTLDIPGRRLVVIRRRIELRRQAGGKLLIEVPGYRF